MAYARKAKVHQFSLDPGSTARLGCFIGVRGCKYEFHQVGVGFVTFGIILAGSGAFSHTLSYVNLESNL
jgi:hypothetical protein